MAMHFCYILINETKTHTYVGYTVSPQKRLRQHNGEIKGGARFTSRHGRAWSFVAIVACPAFDNKRALSLEWHMKPHGRRRSTSFSDPVARRIDLLKNALNLPKFQDETLFWIYIGLNEYRQAFLNAFEHFEKVEILSD